MGRTAKDWGLLRINVLGENYCSQENSVEVSKTIDDSFMALEDNMNNPMNFLIEYRNGIIHRRRLLHHNRGHIVTLKKKRTSLHNRWKAYNLEESVCLFSAKQTWHTTNLDVLILANGKKLKVTGTYSEGTFMVQDVDELDVTIADMRVAGKVTVKPNIDYAFIVALLLIQDELA